MKFVKIYSDNPLFKTVLFHDGINIVLGRINNPENLNKDDHNIGKTKLLELINFLLLSDVSSDFFLIKNPCFANDTFFLVIEVSDNNYITIRRSVKKPTKISIIRHDDPEKTFDDNSNWDYRDVGLKSADNPKEILSNMFGIIINDNVFNYRKISQYFLRNQTDYSDVFKLSKFKGKDVDWKPYLFQLLGFNSEHMENKYRTEKDIQESRKALDLILEHSGTEDKSLLFGQIREIENSISSIKDEMRKMNFFKSDDTAIEKSVTELQSSIKKLNIEKYDLSNELALIDEDLKSERTYDLEKTSKVYEEFKVYFGEQIVKDYNSLCDFNNKISEERKVYLSQVKDNKRKRIDDINQSLRKLNNELEKMQQYITETELSSKYFELSEQVFALQNDLERKRAQMENSNISEAVQKEIHGLKIKLETEISSLEDELNKTNAVLDKIKEIFDFVIRSVTGKRPRLIIKTNTYKNVDFRAEYNAEDAEGTTSEADGNTYKKLLCVAFDLALLIAHSDVPFFNSIYHDGVLESLEDRKKRQFLSCVEELCQRYNFQYIFSSIESDLPSGYDVNGKTCVEFSDDDGDTLFGRTF